MRYFIYCRKSTESEDRQLLSMDSQQEELLRAFGSHQEIEIIEILRESFSAKAPGRPIFNEMIRRIEDGEADGIISWHPDRLARNSIDGGRIIYLLDRNILKDLKFSTFTFESNPQGKFMLSIIFGYSKYYVDSLSENIRRGIRAKLTLGWRPNVAPAGYLNDHETKTIIPDPARFPLIKHIFQLALTGCYSVPDLHRILNNEWGYRTPRRRKTGGQPIGLSTMYTLFENPFYAGFIRWHGVLYPGKQERVVSWNQFEALQQLIGRQDNNRPQARQFAFTGMIRCGECGLMITAEHKTNRQGHRYIYYHCTKRKIAPRCKQPYIRVEELERQVVAFLEAHTVPDPVLVVALDKIETRKGLKQNESARQEEMLKTAGAMVSNKLRNLTELRLNGLIDDAEFTERRLEFQTESSKITETLQRVDRDGGWFEPAKQLVSFSNQAVSWFIAGTTSMKRLILRSISSNLTLKDKILNIQLGEFFPLVPKIGTAPDLWRWLDDVRTLHEKNDPELARTIAAIKEIEALMKNKNNDGAKKKAA